MGGLEDLRDDEKLKSLKENLRHVIAHERLTKLYASLGTPYFYWFHRTFRDGAKPVAAFYAAVASRPSEHTDTMYGKLAPALISIGLSHSAAGEATKLQPVTEILRNTPERFIPKEVRKWLEQEAGGS